MKAKLYHYKARVIKVYDGDTITVDIDLGLGIWKKNVKIRLFGINTPELRGVPEEQKVKGRAARDFLYDMILGELVVIETVKDKEGKYGRLLGTVWLNDLNINQHLIDVGHAVEYMR